MSVIVKGMEMPKSCADCFAISEGLDWCKATGNEVFNPFPKDDLPSFCPLRPLPEKHGRLGDLDEVKTAFPCGESVRTECVRATIDNMETIVEAEGE